MVETESRSSQTRSIKLRSACNQCNTAKVRCSGERHGCRRCLGLQMECIYAESRVGKVQGPRPKRKKTLPDGSAAPTSVITSTSAPVQNERRPELQHKSSTPNTRATAPATQVATESLEQTLQNFSTEQWVPGTWDDEMLALGGSMSTYTNVFDDSVTGTPGCCDLVDAFETNTSSDFSTSVFSTDLSSTSSKDLPSMDSERSHDLVVSCASTAPTAPPLLSPPMPVTSGSLSCAPRTRAICAEPQPSESPPTSSTAQKALHLTKLDSKCILVCSQIITTLENYLLSELNVLDLILTTVRAVAAEMTSLIQHVQESRGERCIYLFLTIMHQIIELLESGSRAMLSEGSDSLPPTSPLSDPFSSSVSLSVTMNPHMPSLGFSAFSLSAEEQRGFRTRVLIREYQNIGELLVKIVALARLGPRGAPMDQESVDQRSKCVTGLEMRLRDMKEKATGMA